LINDLDIALRDPSGALYNYDNDDINNLVGITVPSPDAGDWEIIVTGTNVADGPQTYYLASSDGLTITDMRHPVSDGLNSAGFQSGSIFTETTVAIGGEHICTIFDDSSLQCWGDNSFGQLGDGTTTDRLTMTPVGLETGRTAVSVSAGASHTCVTLDDSSLKCWGRNNQGQLGDGSTTNSLSPVSVALGGFPVQISAGSRHTCAVLTDASLKCWGDNSYGQLGIGSTTDSSSPVAVTFSGGEKVLAVSAGAYHTCARR
jgi:alpha-tubulin suppressor-like RCC1 family protein